MQKDTDKHEIPGGKFVSHRASQGGQFTENEMRVLLASLAALHGHHQLSQEIEALEVEIVCPQCGTFIDLLQDDTKKV